MTYRLIIKKLHLDDTKIIESKLIRDYCKKLDMDYYGVIRYLTHHKHLIRIMRGIFYKPSIEERKLGKVGLNYLDAIKESMKIKGVDNWYFGLESAIKLNNLTHEFFNIDYVISDRLFRAKSFKILGHNIKFIKLKPSLLKFGIIKEGVPHSDAEKTVLDMIYLLRYEGSTEKEIRARVGPYLNDCSRDKLIKYSKRYNNSIEEFAGELI